MNDESLAIFTDANFEHEVLQSSRPVLVDFWATWCAPCRAIAPALAELSREYGARIKLGKLDVDAETRVATQLDVRALPTLLLFRDGKVVGQLVGAAPRAKIAALLQRAFDAAG